MNGIEKQAKYSYCVKATKSGYINKTDAESYGVASLILGAGRNVKDAPIDFSAGIILHKKQGDYVEEGEIIATLYSDDEKSFTLAQEKILNATCILDKAPKPCDLILQIVE